MRCYVSSHHSTASSFIIVYLDKVLVRTMNPSVRLAEDDALFDSLVSLARLREEGKDWSHHQFSSVVIHYSTLFARA